MEIISNRTSLQVAMEHQKLNMYFLIITNPTYIMIQIEFL